MSCTTRSSTTRVRTRVLAVVAIALLMMTMRLGDAQAHQNDQSYLYLDIGETLVARVQLPFLDIDDVFGITLEGTPEQIDELIAAHEDVLTDYAADHVAIGTAAEFWSMEPVRVERFDGARHVEIVFAVGHGPDVPQELVVRFDPFFDEVDDRDALLLVANDWDRGIVDNEAESLVRFTPDSREQEVDLGDSSRWSNFTASVQAGVDHIRTGPDHMLFIIALMLPSVLVWSAGWKPADGFGRSLWRITKIMTMFTLAHSVTFTLTGLGLVPSPSPKVTESIIALSIAATALHNLRPVFGNREWAIAFVFGLFHGFGFASLVQELDVSTATQLVSLLGRNVGIEIGQILVVLLTFPALFILRRTRYYRPFFVTGCVLLIITSLGWATERLFNAKPIASRIIDPIAVFPRVLIPLAIFTATAALLFKREQSADRLIPNPSQ